MGRRFISHHDEKASSFSTSCLIQNSLKRQNPHMYMSKEKISFSFNELQFIRTRHRLSSAVDVQFGKDMTHMGFYRIERDLQAICNGLVGLSLHDTLEYL